MLVPGAYGCLMAIPDEQPVRRRRGRRAGESGTRASILEAARGRFGADGFAGATIRKIANDAGVDPALVMRFYGSKERLFAAALALPDAATDGMMAAFDGPADGIGERLTRAYLGLWSDPVASGPLLTMLRSAVTHEQAAVQVREFLAARLLQAVSHRLPLEPDVAVRAALASSTLLGVVLSRYVVRIEALAIADEEAIVGFVAPILQGLLTPVR